MYLLIQRPDSYNMLIECVECCLSFSIEVMILCTQPLTFLEKPDIQRSESLMLDNNINPSKILVDLNYLIFFIQLLLQICNSCTNFTYLNFQSMFAFQRSSNLQVVQSPILCDLGTQYKKTLICDVVIEDLVTTEIIKQNRAAKKDLIILVLHGELTNPRFTSSNTLIYFKMDPPTNFLDILPEYTTVSETTRMSL